MIVSKTLYLRDKNKNQKNYQNENEAGYNSSAPVRDRKEKRTKDKGRFRRQWENFEDFED
jgi:hypothetical protein